MSVYKCYRGDTAESTIEVEGSFVVQDFRERDWFCHPSPLPTLVGVDRLAMHDATVQEFDDRLRKVPMRPGPGGFMELPTLHIATIEAEDIEDLRRQLSGVESPVR